MSKKITATKQEQVAGFVVDKSKVLHRVEKYLDTARGLKLQKVADKDYQNGGIWAECNHYEMTVDSLCSGNTFKLREDWLDVSFMEIA
ncbi:MAG: hypothetical protein FWC51_03265, partial [Proteobacteria bacterium]|nr:hypothetical protein [Pseudomonadota bacterium]